ncbi:hypothetical protein KCU99_g401, partial [Aureobasidium melanogenum]
LCISLANDNALQIEELTPRKSVKVRWRVARVTCGAVWPKSSATILPTAVCSPGVKLGELSLRPLHDNENAVDVAINSCEEASQLVSKVLQTVRKLVESHTATPYIRGSKDLAKPATLTRSGVGPVTGSENKARVRVSTNKADINERNVVYRFLVKRPQSLRKWAMTASMGSLPSLVFILLEDCGNGRATRRPKGAIHNGSRVLLVFCLSKVFVARLYPKVPENESGTTRMCRRDASSALPLLTPPFSHPLQGLKVYSHPPRWSALLSFLLFVKSICELRRLRSGVEGPCSSDQNKPQASAAPHVLLTAISSRL